jgi:hypothetical protein
MSRLLSYRGSGGLSADPDTAVVEIEDEEGHSLIFQAPDSSAVVAVSALGVRGGVKSTVSISRGMLAELCRELDKSGLARE